MPQNFRGVEMGRRGRGEGFHERRRLRWSGPTRPRWMVPPCSPTRQPVEEGRREGFRIAVANFAALGGLRHRRARSSEPSEYQSGEPEVYGSASRASPGSLHEAMATRLRELGVPRPGGGHAGSVRHGLPPRGAPAAALYLEGEKPETLGPRQNVLFMGPSGCGKGPPRGTALRRTSSRCRRSPPTPRSLSRPVT